MEVIHAIETRRSIRVFEERAVARETMEELVRVASFAPSWKNSQAIRYIVIEDKEMKEKIAEEAVLGFEHNAEIIRNCPTLVIVTCVHGRSGFERDGSYSTSKEDRWEVYDAGIATQTFCLAAHAKGLGSVILGIFDEEKVIDIAEIPEGQVICGLVALGYPAEAPKVPRRKEVTDLVSFR
ncbi:MAG: nitroreductase family protein [bacterium]|nr:nitroreductase family protein [bacterium]